MKSLLSRWLELAAASYPEAPALIFEGKVYSFSALLSAKPDTLPERLTMLQKQADLPGIAELLITTSGSTGVPKQVMLSEANLEAAVRASQSRIPLKPGDIWLACLPLQHIGGIAIFYRCAEAGATTLLHQGFDAAKVRHDMERHGVTHISLVPAMLARLLESGPPPAQLAYALIGGGPLSEKLARRAHQAGWPICPTYGTSETSSQVASLAAFPPDWCEGMVGPPLPGISVEIMDENGQPVKGKGHIRVRGPNVMRGYANAAHEAGHGLLDGWFVSGDRGYLDARGNLVVLGRHDDMLVSGGVNVHPEVVEGLLLACPGVSDIAITAVSDEVWGDLITALIVGGATCSSVQEWSGKNLPSHLRPRRFVSVAALPRNAMGKLERKHLRELAHSMENSPC
ncbi:MAG: AMP-binding protein [Gammaproteobacteria bacterium]|nr:AMP-binding protein [Gammaproteobacteria bacterium]MBU1731255.1 AMP-binding protein [Gammaproteobacteria bacterium]MBU1892760.1 AMP-binding protein [Gammaproteobacteria bacterium]